MSHTQPDHPNPEPPRAAIFANGQISDLAAARAALRPDDLLIAADGGRHHCQALGLQPHAVVGDLDSLEPGEHAALAAAGVQVEQHPARKDETDLELALRLALARGARDILIFGALGGRWDQTLANLLLLAHPDFRAARLRLLDGPQQIYRVLGAASIEGEPGDTVSLIALGGDATGITTTGLDYPLENDTLAFASTRGISNVLLGQRATVTVAHGLLACVVISTGRKTTPLENAGQVDK